MLPSMKGLSVAWHCRCPRCDKGALYKPGFTMDLRGSCEECGLDYNRADTADGPAVFLIFILGFALVPLAIILEFMISPPLWLHITLWSVLALGLTIGMLRPVKSYVIALQFKHRPEMFEK